MAIFAHGCSDNSLSEPNCLVALNGANYVFGDRRQNETLNHVFTLKNVGTTPLELTALKTSCGCLIAADVTTDPVIAPGAQFSLPVEFSTGSAESTVSASVELRYKNLALPVSQDNNIAQERITLRVAADILPDFRITPKEVDFGAVDGLSTTHIRRIVDVVPAALASVSVSDVIASHPAVSARVLPSRVEGEHRIEISLNTEECEQNEAVDTYVLLLTDSNRVPNAFIPVKARYTSLITTNPNAIIVGSDEHGSVEGTLNITTSRPSKIQRVDTATNLVEIKNNGDRVLREHELRFRVLAPQNAAVDELVQVELAISTHSSPVLRSVEIPVYRFAPSQ